MTKLQIATGNAFLLGILLFIVGIALAMYDTDIFFVEPILQVATLLTCGSVILSVINPIKH